MQGMSERQYAVHVGLSRGAIQKAKEAGRLVLFADGSIDAAASDQRRAALTDPSKSRAVPKETAAPKPKLKPVPEAAVASVAETLREEGLPPQVARAVFVVHQLGVEQSPADSHLPARCSTATATTAATATHY